MTWRSHSGGGRFDPADFNVPPSLTKGTSQRLQFYVQSAHARALDIMAHCGHFPWGKDTDVARWAIQFGLQHLDSIDPGLITSVMRQANIINAILQDDLRNQKFQDTVNLTQERVLFYRGTADLEMAKELVNKLWKEILLMPDEPDSEGRWKKKYMDAFETRFKDLIEY